MRSIHPWSDRFDKLFAWIEHAKTAVGLVGPGTWFAVTIVGGIWAWLTRQVDELPLWATGVVALLTCLLVTKSFVAIRTAWAIKGVRSIDINKLGRDCVMLEKEIFEFLVARHESAPDRIVGGGDSSTAAERAEKQWAAGAKHSSITGARLNEKFLGRSLATCHLLTQLGIPAPSFFAFEHSAGGIAAFIGTAGRLLEEGLLDEARHLDPNPIVRMHIH